MKPLQALLLLAAASVACAFSWHDVRAHGRTTAAVVVTAFCTYYATQLQRSAPAKDEARMNKPMIVNSEGSVLQWPRQPAPLSDESLKRIAQLLDTTSMQQHFNNTLDEICVVRQPGTPAHSKVRKFIVSEMKSLGWTVDEHSFSDDTPHGRKPFTNIIATFDPQACHRLVLACHYDSKVQNNFVGAIDSAVPCSQMMNMAKVLAKDLQAHRDRSTGLTIQLLFFDGEEAIEKWSSSDSLYGSRSLAETWQTSRFLYTDENRCKSTNKNIVSELDRIEVLILLDLLGAKNPNFMNFFVDTRDLYNQFASLESRLHRLGLMEGRSKYFSGRTVFSSIEDDHIPFVKRDVPVVHIIDAPFPKVWHESSDNKENLHRPTIRNLNKIFTAFLVWYLGL